jgi:hypothetical protein
MLEKWTEEVVGLWFALPPSLFSSEVGLDSSFFNLFLLLTCHAHVGIGME